MRYFDAHSHIHFPQYAEDIDAVLLRMKEAEISTITVAVDSETSRSARDFAHAHALYATAGLHPSDNRAEELDEQGIRELLLDPRVVAVGECGLDYYRLGENPDAEKARQKDIFRRQIALAVEVQKPVMIHCRATPPDAAQHTDAHEDAIAILEEFPGVQPILHFFTGSVEIAKQYGAFDAYFSFSGVVTFAPMYNATILSVPLDRILTETDAPYATPAPHRGKRNEPSFVVQTLAHIAAVRGLPEEEMRLRVLSNVQRLFGTLAL